MSKVTDNLLLGKNNNSKITTTKKEPTKLQNSWTKMLLNRTNSKVYQPYVAQSNVNQYLIGKNLSVKSDEFFVKWQRYLRTNNLWGRKLLPTKNFTFSKIFWNLFRAFIFTQVAQKYRPSIARLNICATVNTYGGCTIPAELWAHKLFVYHTYFEK